MKKLILPKVFIPLDDIQLPLFFLIGPIKGGDNWQKKCCEELSRQLATPFTVAVPNRWTADLPDKFYQVNGDTDEFRRQTYWERYYIQLSLRHGCLLCWLPCESRTNPRKDGNPYGRDTYGEIGRWIRTLKYQPTLNIVVGAQEGFPGLDQIRMNADEDVRAPFPIYPTLEQTVKEAIKVAVLCARS